MNNVDENNVDAYIEAALGRKMFLLILTPYHEQYISSSVVRFGSSVIRVSYVPTTDG